MARRRASNARSGPSAIEAALESLRAEALRDLVRGVLVWLDDRSAARFADEILARAARGDAGWTPTPPSGGVVSEAVAFAEAARRVGYADPQKLDDYLRCGANAFLCRDYASAAQILRTLLVLLAERELYLGEPEMVDDVVSIDLATCAAQYLVSVYMTAQSAERAQAVRAAISDVSGLAGFLEPIRALEQVAVEPLSDLDAFLPQWRALLEEHAARERRDEWDDDDDDDDDDARWIAGEDWDDGEDRWLREVILRLEGVEGLAANARSTKRAADLRYWCSVLVEAGDWRAALAAYEEAAELAAGTPRSRARFLDGAALAAQELGRKDLPARLKRAWRAAPTLARLSRWLGTARTKRTIRQRAAQALEACSEQAHRQRALLLVLRDDHESAAALLAAAPGLGWSNSEHPGHLLFPVFGWLLSSGDVGELLPQAQPRLAWGTELDESALELEFEDDVEFEWSASNWAASNQNIPRLATPDIDALVDTAAVARPPSASARQTMLQALRAAATKRVTGVTGHKRRRYYWHAAQLVAVCAAVDPSPETAAWLADLRDRYRRFSALQREFDTHLGRAPRG